MSDIDGEEHWLKAILWVFVGIMALVLAIVLGLVLGCVLLISGVIH